MTQDVAAATAHPAKVEAGAACDGPIEPCIGLRHRVRAGPSPRSKRAAGPAGCCCATDSSTKYETCPSNGFPDYPSSMYVLLTAAVAPSGDEGAVPVRRYLDAVALWCLRWGGAVRDSMAAIVLFGDTGLPRRLHSSWDVLHLLHCIVLSRILTRLILARHALDCQSLGVRS